MTEADDTVILFQSPAGVHAIIEIYCVDKRTMKGALGFFIVESPLNTPLMLIGSLDERTGNVSGSTDSPSFPERQTVPLSTKCELG